MSRREFQREALKAFIAGELRMFALLWERQSGKSTTFADIALYEMMRFVSRTVIYASASLLLATEIILKQTQRMDVSAREMVEKEAMIFAQCAERYEIEAKSAGMLFQTANAHTDKILPKVSLDDFKELFESQRLEFRVYHDRTRYSRTKVIAPNVATARSWSGTVILDEVAFIRALKELITALLPIISTKKEFKLVYGTTPPEFDDTHYSFELLAPPAGLTFQPNAAGNWYESESGVRVHRADAFDTFLAGKKIYDLRSGAEVSPMEAYAKAPNKDGHKIAHWLTWMVGGAAACDMLRLKVAQERGMDQCLHMHIDTDADYQAALRWLAEHIDPKAKVGLGMDKATTTKEKSNPTALAIVEESGPEITVRMFLTWKTNDPDVNDERIDGVLDVIERRKSGGRAKAFAIDATNERLDAERQRKKFKKRVPVLLIVASEGLEKPGMQKPTNWKEYTGSQYIAKLDDNHLTLPPGRYVFVDHRLVMKDRGRFVCEPNDEGMHGDTFDAGKLGVEAVCSKRGGDARCEAVAVGGYEGGMG